MPPNKPSTASTTTSTIPSTDPPEAFQASELSNRLQDVLTNEEGKRDKITELDDVLENEQTQTMSRRRQPSVSRPGLTFAGLPSSIPDPVAESIPPTPAHELAHGILEGSSQEQQGQGQQQQQQQQQQPPERPTLNKGATSTTITKLIDYNEPIPDSISNDIMSLHNPPRNLHRLIAGCLWVFTLGLSDGALGALLPYIEEYYDISYAVVSLLWLGNAIGFIIIAFTAHYIDHWLGLQKALTLSLAMFVILFALMSSGTLFPVQVVGFFFGGIGGAMALSQYNIFISKMHNGSKYLGIFHGSYGVGACISPILGTVMINRGVKWHYFYFIPLVLCLCNVVFTPIAFMNCHIDLAKWDYGAPDTTNDTAVELDNVNVTHEDEGNTATQEQAHTSETPAEPKHDFKAAMKDYRSWLTCAFIFFYQGTEVSIGGWMVTYLIDYRGANKSTIGYVSSGIWGGVAIGRLFLTHNLANWFGVRRSIMVLQFTIVLLDLLAWFIPNIIVEATCASLIGLCIGPIYPMMVSLLTRILPRKIRFNAMTLGTAFGSSGGSAVPFAVGMASQFAGTYVLHPIFLVCYVFMFISWVFMPNIERKGGQSTLWQKFW